MAFGQRDDGAERSRLYLVSRGFSREWNTDRMIVNLNRYRKQRRRSDADARAAENRIRYGRSKEQRTREQSELERATKVIEDKRLK